MCETCNIREYSRRDFLKVSGAAAAVAPNRTLYVGIFVCRLYSHSRQ